MQGKDATKMPTLWRYPRYQEGIVKPHWNTPRLQPCEDRQLMNCTRSGLGSQGRLPEDGDWDQGQKQMQRGTQYCYIYLTVDMTVDYIAIV